MVERLSVCEGSEFESRIRDRGCALLRCPIPEQNGCPVFLSFQW